MIGIRRAILVLLLVFLACEPSARPLAEWAKRIAQQEKMAVDDVLRMIGAQAKRTGRADAEVAESWWRASRVRPLEGAAEKLLPRVPPPAPKAPLIVINPVDEAAARRVVVDSLCDLAGDALITGRPPSRDEVEKALTKNGLLAAVPLTKQAATIAEVASLMQDTDANILQLRMQLVKMKYCGLLSSD